MNKNTKTALTVVVGVLAIAITVPIVVLLISFFLGIYQGLTSP
jgi:hypothetical protein